MLPIHNQSRRHFKSIILLFPVVFLSVYFIFYDIACAIWPFDSKEPTDIVGLIKDYKNSEKKSNYDDIMFERLKSAVNADAKKNFVIRMAYMRMSYFKAVNEKDLASIKRISNEAESLLQGDHPMFRQEIQDQKVSLFLQKLKGARYNEKHSINWIALIITTVVLAVICGIAGAHQGASGAIGGAIFGVIAGIFLYNYILISIFYSVRTEFSMDIPFVPII